MGSVACCDGEDAPRKRRSMATYDAYNMPDLSGLFAKQVLNTMLNLALGGHSAAARVAHAEFVNLVRLTDKAINEYEAARAALADFVKHRGTGRFSPLFRAADHLENCINATRRAFEFADALRRNRRVAPIPRHPLPRPPEVRLIRTLRDTVEHLYDNLKQGKVVPGQAQFLKPAEKGLEIGSVSVSWLELAALLRRLHALVEYVNAQPDEPNDGR